MSGTAGERAGATTERVAVGVMSPGVARAFDRSLIDALETRARVSLIDWGDPPPVRAAKSDGTRTKAWIRAHERPLEDAQRERLAGTEVLLTLDLPIDVEQVAPRLRFVQGVGAGVTQLVAVLRETSVRLTSAAGVSGEKVAEFAMARLLSVWTDARRLDALQRSRRWTPEEVETASVSGRTVVVVGTGGIGTAFALRAVAFGLTVVGVRRRPELGAPPGFQRVVGPDALHDALAEADAVVLAAPATSRTRQLVGKAELEAMRAGAVLVNVARGALVDEDALVRALESGHLGAAVLDVTAHEPLPRSSPLWKAPRTYISPHVANAWRPEYMREVGALFVDNLERYLEGRPLRNEVDLHEGY